MSTPTTMEEKDPLENNPFRRFYKDGKIQRPIGTPYTPASDDPKTGVTSKDVTISSDPLVSARLYLPPNTTTTTKLPVVVYFHGGAFSIESAFSTLYHTHLNTLTATARVLAVSVEYRLAPENLIPACYEDCWATLKWIENQQSEQSDSPDPWIKNHADLNRVFLAGDSAGANIAHNMAVRAGIEGATTIPKLKMKIPGMALIHPYYEYDSELWLYICPGTVGYNDTRINPASDPVLMEKIVCEKAVVCLAEDDKYRPRAFIYYETLKKSGWKGRLDLLEQKGKKHAFHLTEPDCDEAHQLVNLLAKFFNEE